jgi:adenosine deaminase
VQVTDAKADILEFFKKFEWLTAVMVDYDACRRIAYENVEDARNEGIDYIELRFSPWFMAETHMLEPTGVVEAVVDGIKAGERDFGIPVGIIGIISRTYGPDSCMRELEALATCKDDIYFPGPGGGRSSLSRRSVYPALQESPRHGLAFQSPCR